MSTTDPVFICSDSSVSHGNVIIPLESIATNASEMNNLDAIGTSFSQPQQSPSFQSNEFNEIYDLVESALHCDEDKCNVVCMPNHTDSLLHSSQTPSNSFTSQPVSSCLDQFSSNLDQSSPNSIQADINFNSTFEQPNPTLKPPIILSKPSTSKRNIRGKKFRTPKDMYLQYCSSERKECKMMRNRKELLAHLRTYHHINLDQPNSLQSIPLTLNSETLSSQQQQQSSEEELALQCKEESSLQSSSQHFVRESRIDGVKEKVDNEMELNESSMKKWTWNEVEKCWELMKNDQIDGDEEDSEDRVDQLNGLDNLSNIECAEPERNLRPYNQQQILQQPQHQQINPDQFNPNSTQSTSSNQTKFNPFPSRPVSSSLDQFSGNLVQSSRECRIDDQEEKVDDEMKSIESSMKGWTWNEVEKCWELMKNDQFDGDEGNDEIGEVGEECDDGENEEEDLDKDVQYGVDQLNRIEHESNIEVTVAPGDDRPNNMNTLLTTPQFRDPLELLNDQSAPTSSYRNNTIPIQLEKSFDDNGLNEHSVYSSLPVTLDQPNPPTHLSTPLSDCTMFQANSLPSKSASSSFNCDDPVSNREIEVINVNKQLEPVIIDDYGLNGSNLNRHQQQQLCKEPILHQAIGLSPKKDSNDHLMGKFELDGTNSAQSKQNDQVLVPDKLTVKHVFEKCGKEFKTRSNLINHFQVHSDVKPFACTWKDCGQTFARHTSLKEHICKHTGEKPFACTWKNCGQAFVRRYNLNVHIRTHSCAKPFICPWKDCHKSFARKCTMQVHHMAHSVKLPADLTGHTRSQTKKRLLLNCPSKDCGKTFVTKLGLKLHLESHAGISGTTNKHLCKYCGKTFKTSFILTGHFRTHTGEKPFKCLWKDCDKTFGQKSNLKTHFIGHSLRSIQRETIPNGIFNLASDGAQSAQQQQQQ